MNRKPFSKTEMAYFYRRMRDRGMGQEQAYKEVANLIDAHLEQYKKNQKKHKEEKKSFKEAFRELKEGRQ